MTKENAAGMPHVSTVQIEELFEMRMQSAEIAIIALRKLISVEMAMISFFMRAQIDNPTQVGPNALHVMTRTFEGLYTALSLIEDIKEGTAGGADPIKS